MRGRKEHLWRMTPTTAEKWQALMDLLEFYEEDSDDYAAIRDEIKSLPGHPLHTTENDFIRWEIIKVHV